MAGIIKAIGDVLLGRLIMYLVLGGIPIMVGLALVGGTGTLTALGLSRDLAGSIVAVVVVVGCVAGLGAFAKYGIDW